MATFPVKYLHSGMRGAPVLSGTAGTLIALIDACLIHGFGQVTLTSLVVSGGVATATVNAGDSFEAKRVIALSGATPAALNGEQRVLSSTSTTFTFATSAPDGAATGTVTAKYAPVGGWEKSFSGTNKAAYKSIDPQANGHWLRVDDGGTDSNQQRARVIGYEAMTDVDTGSGPFPTEGQRAGGGSWWKSQGTNANAVRWKIFGDSRFFLFVAAIGTTSNATYTSAAARGFGDVLALAPGGDAWSTVLSWAGDSSTYINRSSFEDGNFAFNVDGRMSMPRDYSGIGSAVLLGSRSFIRATGVSGAVDFSLGPFPSPVDGRLRLSKMFLVGDGSRMPPRAVTPGVLFVPHTDARAFFEDGAEIVGTDDLAGRSLISIHISDNAAVNPPSGVYFVDATGPWR